MDKVSIIVPIYNVKDYLGRCIDSLLSQTYENIEILLVDDCSSDGSAAVAAEYAGKAPNKCIFIQRSQNGGLSAARNTGLKSLTGEWVTFVDSDDWVDSDYIEVLLNTALSDGADIVMSCFYHSYPSGIDQFVSPVGDMTTGSSHCEKIAHSDSCACTRLFKASLFKDNGIIFPEDIWRSEDIATVIPMLTKTSKISIVKKAMYHYFQRSSSLSNTNYRGVDVSFFPKTVNRMIELSSSGFEPELEYRAINELMYGMNMIMLRAGYKRSELKENVDDFAARFPEWRTNKYYHDIPLAKRIFIKFADRKMYLALKLLILMWDAKQLIQRKQKG